MPKIIENLETRLIEEARKQIEEAGYSAMTIRSVAKGCGVGVGTVYNYFPSKDVMVATYLLGDWKNCVTAIEAVSSCAEEPSGVIRCMYDQLVSFAQRHRAIFEDAAAMASYMGSSSRYHQMLRSQLAAPLRRFCEDAYASEFIAEALLTWSMAGTSFEQIYGMIKRLF